MQEVEMVSAEEMWGEWVRRTVEMADKNNFLGYLPKVCLPTLNIKDDPLEEIQVLEGPGPWDRTLLEVEVDCPSTARTSSGGESRKKMVLFSGNDYLNLSAHPAVRMASMKAAKSFGMGPRASSLISGHTDYHRRLEALLAEMHCKESCVMTPTGFAANTSLLAALGAIASYSAAPARAAAHQKIAVFSDALNHASIIDGLRMMERQHQAIISVYKHSDMRHLEELLSNCPNEKKVVITDSLFSMEGDFAPMLKLVELRKKHRFLLVVDEAHTALVCGRTGGGVGELFDIQDQIDIIVGTLSKATGCLGGYIACSNKFTDLVRGCGRSNIFTTASPLPVVAACYAAVTVARKEGWRREALWRKVHEFAAITGHPATSPIISLVVGSELAAIKASNFMLDRGFHVTAVRPPAVSPDACRLRVTLTAGHTFQELRNLIAALAQCIPGLSPPADLLTARL